MNEPDHAPPISTAQLHWNDRGMPVSSQFDDIYFSDINGLEESRYVFLQGNRLAERWPQLAAGSAFTIGESGFGTGLNFLAAWQLWRSAAPAEARLHFLSVERFPLRRADLIQALALWPQLADLGHALIASYPPQPSSGMHRLCFDGGRVMLTLYFGDAARGFEQWGTGQNAAFGPLTPRVDAWFLDGFAPAKNPQMWTEALFQAVGHLSGTGTTFATFTAAGAVRRGLAAVGFCCEKIKGFGSKREMLVGAHSGLATAATPGAWYLLTPKAAAARANGVAIVGGGIAACSTAAALARRGIAVTLYERAEALASGGSGNRQGVVYGRLSPHPDALSQFNLAAQLFANRYYAARDGHQRSLFERCGAQCGVAHLAGSEQQRARYRALAERYADEPEFVQWLEGDASAATCGLALAHPALFVARAGWLDPRALCQALCQHPLIDVRTRSAVAHLCFDEGQWRLLDAAGGELGRAHSAVIANAQAALQFEQSAQLPLKSIRGQVSHLAADTASDALRTVLCGEGYIAPAHQGLHTCGATFTLNQHSTQLSSADHRENLGKLPALAPALAGIAAAEPGALAGKVGFRCTTPDYFPLVGPVPDYRQMCADFAGLRHNARHTPPCTGSAHPQLYCNLGHGSRGLCYSPLAAELLASLICGEALPLGSELYRHLHPARFIIRDLIRARI